MPDYATEDEDVYWWEISKLLDADDTYVLVDNGYRGFWVIIDDYEAITPEYHRYVMTKIFIEPQYRKGRVLKQMYDKIEEMFTDGDIVGTTEASSEHVNVLMKRHELLAYIFKRRR
jgi:hypothetical protein